MKSDDGPIFDFGDNEQNEDESYLLQDGDADPISWCPSPRPLNLVLKAARRRLRLTQEEMAGLMGVSLRSYKGYEIQDVRKVPATALQLLSERTNISPAYLLTGYDPVIDYYAVLREAAILQQMIWEVCLRPDGHQYGMNTQLQEGEATEIAKMLLTQRDRRRREQDNPALEVTRNDILDAVDSWTDHNRVADWEWEKHYDPAYYGHAPFPCPAMYVVPEFLDMADFERYSRLRRKISAALTEQDRALYYEWSKARAS